jgi:hypothetical protein
MEFAVGTVAGVQFPDRIAPSVERMMQDSELRQTVFLGWWMTRSRRKLC